MNFLGVSSSSLFDMFSTITKQPKATQICTLKTQPFRNCTNRHRFAFLNMADPVDRQPVNPDHGSRRRPLVPKPPGPDPTNTQRSKDGQPPPKDPTETQGDKSHSKRG